MPLTRHFYALDEVQTAVYYCGGRAAWKETVFWCRELALSGHAAEAIVALFESWLWNRGPFHMGWFVEAMARLGGEEVSMEALLTMAEALSRCPVKDHSLWTMLVASAVEGEAEDLFDRVTHRAPVVGFPSGANECEMYMIRAIAQHKAGAAWWAAEGMTRERVECLLEWYEEHVLCATEATTWREALRHYERLLGYRSEAYDRAILGVRLLSLCLTTDQRKKSMAPVFTIPLYGKEEAEWDRVLGRKAGRIFPIPYHGLYGVTVRGRMRHQESTVGELWDVQQGMAGCACWENLEERGGLDACFPDDLPDEWTAEEKGRSHGAGLLGRGEGVTLWGWMRRYMTGTTRLLWGRGYRLIQKDAVRLFFDRVPLDDSPFLTLLSLPRVGRGEKPLGPVRKRNVITG
jgi:hypothetical protein